MPEVDRPAIEGGPPAKTVPYTRAERYGEPELAHLREALEQGTLFYAQGAKVRGFEEAFAQANSVPHAVACSSGTAAIHAALIALGISPGDEVITSPITDMGTVIPILFQGAVPVFADLDPGTYNLDPDAVEAAITERTRAVIAVHLAGNACNLNALRQICGRRGIALVEDCAQALGCHYNGEPIGTFGEIGCFSLNEFKHISCGDGGIAVTRDSSLARRLRLATDKAYNRSPEAAERNPAFLAGNYRMTELQGAVALAQMERLPGIVARRRAWCTRLTEQLAALPGLRLPAPTPGCEPSWWFYMLRVLPEALGADAEEFAAALRAEGLPASSHYIGVPVYLYPLFTEKRATPRGTHAYYERDYRKGLCPVSEQILETCVVLAINEGYTDADLQETVAGFHRVCNYFQARIKRPVSSTA